MAESQGGHGRNEDQNATTASHAPVAHAPASHDSTEHGAVALGPVDWPAWVAGAVGVLAGLLVIAAFFLASRT